MVQILRELDFSKITVGKVYRDFKGGIEGGQFDFLDNGGVIKIIYYKPSITEIKEIGQGEVQFRIIEKYGVLILLVKFGKLNWMDFPYHVDLSIWLIQYELPEVKDIGYPVNIILADGLTGIVKVFRKASLSVSMSKRIKEITHKQKGNIQLDYNNRIKKVYAMHDINDLVNLASIDDIDDLIIGDLAPVDNVKEDKKPGDLFKKNKLMAGKQKYELYNGSSKIFPAGTDVRGKVDLYNLKRITTWSSDGTQYVVEFPDNFKETEDKEYVQIGVLPCILADLEKDLQNAKIHYERAGFQKGETISGNNSTYMSFDTELIKLKTSDKEVVREMLRKYG